MYSVDRRKHEKENKPIRESYSRRSEREKKKKKKLQLEDTLK